MKRIGLVVGLALVGFACADTVGQMLVDAGESLQDGSVPPAQGQEVSCNRSETKRDEQGGATYTYRWAEFEVDPGATEVTTCIGAVDTSPYNYPISDRSTCFRRIAPWYRGTTTGWVQCSRSIDFDNPDTPDRDEDDPTSITVHR